MSPSLGSKSSVSLKLGIDSLLADPSSLYGKRVGIITNQVGVDSNFCHLVDELHNNNKVNLTTLFAPEHGLRGAEVGLITDTTDPLTGLPIHSLFGDNRRLTANILKEVDVIIYDLQDVGVRFWTFTTTLMYAIDAAAENDLEVMVLDRPNPIRGINVEGPVLEKGFESFVGAFPMPISHGMTVGELAKLYNEEYNIGAKLTVIPMQNWTRDIWYDETGLKVWIMPSPNMPTLDTATVYPGTCLFEGTNVSEGRGTTRPFELIGAPYIDAYELADYLTDRKLPGVFFRPQSFIPRWGRKYGEEWIHGVQIHVTNRVTYLPVRTGVEMVSAINTLYPDDFSFRPESFDRLSGTEALRLAITNNQSVEDIVASWQSGLDKFKSMRTEYLMY